MLDKSIKGICNKLIFPGDKVVLQENKIIGILKRKNILSRDKYDSSRNGDLGVKKIIATNIDLAMIVVSANEPPLHPKLIDRYMILLQNAHIPYMIILNKSDLISHREQEILKLYKKMGIEIIETSTVKRHGINDLKKHIKGRQVVFLGHSGVGKSSLTRAIVDDEKIRVGKLNINNNKGSHTTTTSTYYKWDEDSGIIDTPGIRSLDIKDFPMEDIQNYYIEFKPYIGKCKYKNCLHYKENDNDCEIKRQVNKGNISRERYESYYKIISGL